MIKIWSPTVLLPPVLVADDRLAAAKAALEYQLRQVSELAVESILLPRLDELSEELVDALANQFHVDFYEQDAPIESKRELVRDAVSWHRRRGTPVAVEEIVRHVFAETDITEWFEYDGEPYYFRILSDITSDIEQADRATLNRLRQAINASKNARSWLEFIQFVLLLDDDLDFHDSTFFDIELERYDAFHFGSYEPTFEGVASFGDDVEVLGLARFDGQFSFDGYEVLGNPNYADASTKVKPLYEIGSVQRDTIETIAFDVMLDSSEPVTVDAAMSFNATLARSETVSVGAAVDVEVTLTRAEEASVGASMGFDLTVARGEAVSVVAARSLDVTMADMLDRQASIVERSEAQYSVLGAFDGLISFDGLTGLDGRETGLQTMIDHAELERWATLRAELGDTFDEACVCGAGEYVWHRSAIRIGGEQFSFDDLQIVTVQIRCARCGEIIAEYLVDDPRWEALL